MRQNHSALRRTFCVLLWAQLLFQSFEISGEVPGPVTPATLDETFHFAETNLTGINDIELFPDGRIAYGGTELFRTVGTAGPNGELMDGGAFGFSYTNVSSLAVDPVDRTIHTTGAGTGDFITGVEKAVSGIDLTWTLQNQLRGRGNKVVHLADRSLLVAGRWQVPGDTNNTYGLVRLDLTGSIDRSFFYDTTAGMEVTDAALLADGSILAAFQQTNENQLYYGYYRWASNGLISGIPVLVTNSRVSAMASMPGTNLVLLAHEKTTEGGIETTFSWVNDFGAASGPADEWPTVNGKVHAIAFETLSSETQNAGGYDRVIIAGEFSRVGTNDSVNLASLNKDGSVAWCFPTNSGPDGAIRDVEVQWDGKVLIAGYFTNVSGVEAKGVARILGSTAEGRNYLVWADSDYAASETAGEAVLTLKRSGDLQEALVVNLSANSESLSTVINVPLTVTFEPGASEAQAQVGIINNPLTSGRQTLQINATTTNANIINTRSTTTLAVLDDEKAGTLDPRFVPSTSIGQYIFGIQKDGKIIFGGYGTSLTRVNPDGSIDPTFVTNGLPGDPTAEIHQILPQPDGKIYVAGRFVTTNAMYGINHVARLNKDGTLDRTFDPRLSRGSQLGRFAKIRMLHNRDLVLWLGSGISREGGIGGAGFFRLDIHGRLVQPSPFLQQWLDHPIFEISESNDLFYYRDRPPTLLRKLVGLTNTISSFPPTSFSGQLYTMQPYGNSLFVGGNFTQVRDQAATNLALLDSLTGTVQSNFNAIVDGTVRSIRIHEGKLYITGDFTAVNGQPRFRVARLSLDGTVDHDFNPGLGPNSAPGLLGVQADGSVIIGSSFSRVDGVDIQTFARLLGTPSSGEIRFVSRRIELTGTNDFVELEMERVGGSWGQISSTLSTVDGSASGGEDFASTNLTVTYLDGEFGRKVVQIPLTLGDEVSGPLTFSVVAGNLQTSEEATVLIRPAISLIAATASAAGSTNVFRDIAIHTNGWVYAVGSFTNVNGVDVTNIVRLNADLEVDETFRLANLPARIVNGATNYFTPLNTVAVNDDGIAVGGAFNLVGTNNWTGVVRLKSDGTYDEAFNRTRSANLLQTTHLVNQPDGRLVASLNANEALRFERDGTLDPTFDGLFQHGRDLWLDSLGRFYSSLPDGVYRYDTFGFPDPFPNGRIIAVTFQVTGSLPPSPILNTLAIQPDDKILVGGAFTHVGTTTFGQPPTPRLVRVLTNRVLDTNFVAVVGTNTPGSAPKNRVTAIQTLNDGNILIGGIFDVVNGERRTMLALLNTNGELRKDFQVEVVGEQIDQFALLPDGDVVVRGRVSSVDGIEVGDLFKLDIPAMQVPVARFLWPTNGAEVRVSDTQDFIRVHAFDPDGFIEMVVLELDGQIVATNQSGNVPFELFLPESGEHQLRMTATDDSGQSTSETVTFRTLQSSLPQTLTIHSDAADVVITYQHGRLFESIDLNSWTEIHSGGGQFRTTPSAEERFYRAGQ